ncbi:glycosyltransferase family 4 protein [Thiorhodovibrio frisius]|uniref:Glycosyltransferase n=1 Tax=Thiorhodovibrio frisius TaxID=631362 RepID=H8Z1C5_9GAMM|nr:glycosyltransferase family 1 protein [Thiorhodovibrio frisius]EIC22474.1 glycosyltransferase [Thiorhodovibrio frisius]WPL24775.1 GDP-mannose-dependent alpha-mannosyltransferase [Thiorhodovibrio frisius]
MVATAKPSRLVVVTETYPPEINGVANTMHQLVTGLERLGHRIVLVRPRQSGERLGLSLPPSQNNSGTAQFLVPGLPIPGYSGLRFGLPVGGRLLAHWKQWNPQAVYIATQGPLGRAALSCARQLGIPALTGFHTQFHQYSRYYGLGLLMRPIVKSLRRFHNRANATLVPTKALQVELAQAGFENLRVFSRGVDTNLFSPTRRCNAQRRAWGCEQQSIAVLYVGRLAAEKNIALAFAAFATIAATGSDCKFILVGDGPERERLARQHPDYVFTGARVGQALATQYASADLFLFPSLTETFGNVVPEAMASGLPVIAFDYAAARQHIRSGENGIVVPVDDRDAFIKEAVDLARNPARLRDIGQAARQSAAAMDWEHVIRDLEQDILALVEQKATAEKTDACLVATSN